MVGELGWSSGRFLQFRPVTGCFLSNARRLGNAMLQRAIGPTRSKSTVEVAEALPFRLHRLVCENRP